MWNKYYCYFSVTKVEKCKILTDFAILYLHFLKVLAWNISFVFCFPVKYFWKLDAREDLKQNIYFMRPYGLSPSREAETCKDKSILNGLVPRTTKIFFVISSPVNLSNGGVKRCRWDIGLTNTLLWNARQNMHHSRPDFLWIKIHFLSFKHGNTHEKIMVISMNSHATWKFAGWLNWWLNWTECTQCHDPHDLHLAHYKSDITSYVRISREDSE